MSESIEFANVRADRRMFADWSNLYIELRVIAKQLGYTTPHPVDVNIVEVEKAASALLAAMKLGAPADPSPAAAAVPPEFVLPHIAAGIGGGIDPAELPDELAPMTGAEALDAAAAQGADAFADTLNNVIGAFADIARREDDREEGESTVQAQDVTVFDELMVVDTLDWEQVTRASRADDVIVIYTEQEPTGRSYREDELVRVRRAEVAR